ncbi:MAG: hypothetical protein IJT70_00505 [Clostridia bacterium]|nr:hypothetical protein [Clostridia bacterium]
MNSKKWAISLISLTLVIVLLFGAAELFLDPLLQYGKEPGHLTYREYSELYSNPGIAKNYDYNAVLLGSSMVENTDVSEINELFGCTTIKVPYSGGSSYNHKTILEVCYDSGKQIDKVFWSLDEYALTTDKDTPRYPLPEYLYDSSKINDLSYLLNLDIFYFYTLKDVAGTLTHKTEPMMKDGDWTKDPSAYCTANALSSVKYPMEQNENLGEKHFEKNLTENMDCNIIPLVKAHPETEFNFYMVPYSILYWYQDKQKGILDAGMYDAEYAVGELLKYENVKIHFFQDDYDIITDLDLYKDYSHFNSSVNGYISREMAKGSHLLSADNYRERLRAFGDYLRDFDYDGFITGKLGSKNNQE